jgi:hypothetical protein
VCHIFFTFDFFSKKMTKKNKASESLPGDKPRASKCKTQQSAPLASAVSTVEKTTKPKSAAVAAEGAPSVADVSKGSSATNVVEEERKMPALPKYAAVPRAVFGAGGVEAQGGAADKMEEVKEKEKEDDNDNDDSGGSNVEEEEELGDDRSKYNPDGSAGDGTVNLAVDADNLPDEVKPSQQEKVSSPFDLHILPIAKNMLVKQGKKGKQGPKLAEGDDESILLLTDDEAKEATPSKQKKKVLAAKSPPPGSASKMGTSASSKDALMMIKGCQELFFNLPWQNYVSVFGPFTFQSS